MAFNPYLYFGGTCREAFTRYQEIFGGELTLLTLGDMPSDQPVPEDQAHLIMHAALMIDGDLLMASDDPAAVPGEFRGVHVNYTVGDVAEAERVFAALAEGGQTTLPMSEVFWAPRFGMCNDRFGVPWMVNAEAPDHG